MWRRKATKPPDSAGTSREIALSEIIPLIELERIVLPERLADAAKARERKEEKAALENLIERFVVEREDEKKVEEAPSEEQERQARTAIASGYKTDLGAEMLANEIINNASYDE